MVVLIAANAVLAVAAILGVAGDRDWEVIGTTMLVTAGTLIAAINAAAVDRGVSRLLAFVGTLWSWFAFGVFIWWIWRRNEPGDTAQDIVFSFLTIGLGATFAAAIRVPKVPRSFEPARIVAILADAVLVVLTLVAIIWEKSRLESFGVVSVIGAAAALIVLVGMRSQPDDVVATHCPACGASLNGDPGRCASCGARFSVQFR